MKLKKSKYWHVVTEPNKKRGVFQTRVVADTIVVAVSVAAVWLANLELPQPVGEDDRPGPIEKIELMGEIWMPVLPAVENII